MFCNQCEQTARGSGCTVKGVCGKDELVATRQDILIEALRELSRTVLNCKKNGMSDETVDGFFIEALFMTLTNVNFDPAVLDDAIEQALQMKLKLEKMAGREEACPTTASTVEQIAVMARSPERFSPDPDECSAMQLVLYGLKGIAAYAWHAAELGWRDPELYAFMHKALAADSRDGSHRSLDAWLELALECGHANLRAMELLDQANTTMYGNPVPTQVSLGHRKGKCILVSGHDLKDLHELLKQTQGTGINIYTHGEMLPAHGYPQLHGFDHLAGHFGTAWQNQHKELPAFPGPVLFTTNCIQNPEGYADKIFTSGATGWPGCLHCHKGDFSELIRAAHAMPGFDSDKAGQTVTVGFGRQTLLGAAPAVLETVKAGALRHIFLVGGCDGAKPGRNYYTEFVEQTPPDTLILTLACGKFRFFDKDLGTLGAFPRLLDVGQCNDAYTAIRVALALADALNTTVNDLPLSLVLSWYEQKAVSILLTLLALGVKNIRLGPSLPAFVSPNILNILVEKWGIRPVTTPEEDLREILG